MSGCEKISLGTVSCKSLLDGGLGAGVEVGILRGSTMMSLGNIKDSKNDRPEIQRFHADSNLFNNMQPLFKHFVDLKRLPYVFGLSTIIQDLLRFHHRIFHFYLKRSDIPIVLGPPEIENRNLQNHI